MKLLYDSKAIINLAEYGIEIPLQINTANQVKFNLEKKYSNQKLSKIFYHGPLKNLNEIDLKKVHETYFIDRCLDPQNVAKEIMKAYELVSDDGSFHRFNKDKQTKPFSDLLGKLLRQCMGTYTACEIALNKAESNGFCFYLGGGQHHASYKKGMGFCLLNDLVISARKLIDKNKAKKVLIIDTDAHKGDGTSYLTYKDSSIKSLSIHMGSSWPLDTGKFENAKLSTSHYPSDWDIPIYKNTNHLYLKELAKHLDIALKEDFDLVIVAAGADPYYEDELASTDELALSLEVMLERDKLVYSKVKETRTPQAWLMAGGYGIQTWRVYYQFLDFMLKKPNLF